MKTPALLPVWICLACTCGVAGTVEVTAHGAAGDGVTNDTAAIQGAIDACAAGGGGDVVLPTGRYLSGSLTLKSGVRLVVTPEATLLGSTSMADYPGRRLISATDAAGVGITGGGTIDGQGNAFWERRPERGPAEAAWHSTAQSDYRALARPAFLHFLRCSQVSISNIRLTNSPSWTVHLQRCTGATLERVTIRNPLYGPNTDGIDINSCIDVVVRDCDIITGDDGVVLKSTEPGHDHPSRNITVADCRIWSACNCLKLGTETHDRFENITFRGCHLYGDSADLRERPLAGVAIESVDGAELSGITVADMTMSNVRAPLFIRLGHRGGNSERTRQVEPRVPGRIRNVVVRKVRAEHASFESSITGIPGHDVEGVSLSQVTLEYEGGGRASWVTDEVVDEAVIARYPEAQMFGHLPACGLYCRHVTGLRLTDVRVTCLEPDPRPLLVCDDVKDLTLDGLRAAAAPARFPLLWFLGVSGATIRRCAAPAGTTTFLAAEGSDEQLKSIVMTDNDLAPAAMPFQALPRGGLISADLPVFQAQPPGLVVIPARAMCLAEPMVTQQAADLAAGACIGVPTGQGRDTGAARCRVELAADGEYVLWVQVFAPSGEEDSFYAAIDGGPPSLSDVVIRHGAWGWDRVRNRVEGRPVAAAQTVFPLRRGSHRLLIVNRESGTRIATVVLVRRDLDFDPGRDLK